MNMPRRYLPLITFVVPDVVIAYAIVIPRSCIAGINELTVGFALTMLGACFAYIAGQRAVTSQHAETNKFWARIWRSLSEQAGSPHGVVGRALGLIWPFEHARLNRDVLDRLDIQPGQRVLEIGCGPGHALAEAARRTRGGYALGIDISTLMVRMTARHNHAAIERGEVSVRQGDVASAGLEPASFDRIYAVHCIYFWEDVELVLQKLAAALRPGGTLVLAFRPENGDVPARLRGGSHRFPSITRTTAYLERAGLTVQPPFEHRTKGVVSLVATAHR
jgi:SAM-dependent methyltransferase